MSDKNENKRDLTHEIFLMGLELLAVMGHYTVRPAKEFILALWLVPVAFGAKLGIMTDERKFYEEEMAEGRALVKVQPKENVLPTGLRGLMTPNTTHLPTLRQMGKAVASFPKSCVNWLDLVLSDNTPGWMGRYSNMQKD